MKTNRQAWVDYARGIAIILVLYRHVFEGIKYAGISIEHYMPVEYANIMFYSFRMPLFFIVSGFFVAKSLQKRGLGNFIGTKARTIIYPYFIWGFIQITLQLIFSSYVNADKEQMHYIYLLYSPRQVGQFWYLYALFNVAVLYVLVKTVLKIPVWINAGIGLLMYLISAYIFQHNFNVWFLSDILHYYLFFAIGDAVSGFINNPKNEHYLKSPKILLLALLPFLALQAWYLYLNLQHPMPHYDYVEYYLPFLFLLIALVGCSFVILLSNQLEKQDSLKWLRVLGEHSLYIYVAHVVVMAGLRIFLMHVLHVNNLPVLLISGIVSGLIIPVWIYKLAKKANMEWLFALKEKSFKK
ncbi:MAG TPA: acyltransferase [Ferruginibacter sp.]|nr:acyltransferase [Bacteroidota bacterium]MBS1924788.1 acyltransferase [Bacteroidota bacterium]MCC6692336.1 acyltransferase [Chitinophagaceae bacterium]HMT95152.1 acyltransferase [Ferruginibacter sp.]HMU24369.1 acyltransferase [Ferruginibacter sp.]